VPVSDTDVDVAVSVAVASDVGVALGIRVEVGRGVRLGVEPGVGELTDVGVGGSSLGVLEDSTSGPGEGWSPAPGSPAEDVTVPSMVGSADKGVCVEPASAMGVRPSTVAATCATEVGSPVALPSSPRRTDDAPKAASRTISTASSAARTGFKGPMRRLEGSGTAYGAPTAAMGTGASSSEGIARTICLARPTLAFATPPRLWLSTDGTPLFTGSVASSWSFGME
jgi:hypothetical protein